ncbi:hypothetical protein M065_4955 [Bacteroides fragilis str. Korea 419]|nr:hypothetical protein M065_4955 [Bacteroides fragilis str. Korea 419]
MCSFVPKHFAINAEGVERIHIYMVDSFSKTIAFTRMQKITWL